MLEMCIRQFFPQIYSKADMKLSVMVLLYGGGIYVEKFSCRCLRSEESHMVFFFSVGNVFSLCDSNFCGEVYVLLSFFYEKEPN
jgi:hypothetical protein